MYKANKRGVSPVVATVLLIVIALALALIIFLWAKSFFAEKIVKDNSDIAMSCEQVSFSGDITETKLRIENQGNIALYGVRIDKVEGVSVEEHETIVPKPVLGGQSVEVSVTGLSEGESVVIVPIILGQNSEEEAVEFACESSAGLQLDVLAAEV